MNEIDKLIIELTSGVDARAEAAVAELTHYGRDALSVLSPLLCEQDADIRWWAVRAVAEINNPEASKLLRKALADNDSNVRQCAALAIIKQPDPGAVDDLCEVLSCEDRLLARLAGDALISIGEAAVPALIEVLQAGYQPASVEAARALAKISDERAIPSLYNLLESGSALMSYWAEEGLERMGVGMVYFKP